MFGTYTEHSNDCREELGYVTRIVGKLSRDRTLHIAYPFNRHLGFGHFRKIAKRDY